MKQELRSDGNSTLYYLVLHEVGHILGIGALWYMGTSTAIYEMISDQGTNNPFYTGENAVREYNPEFGEPHYPQPAPLTSEFYYLIDRVEKYIDLNFGIPELLQGFKDYGEFRGDH